MKTVLAGCLLLGVLLNANPWPESCDASPDLLRRAHQPSDRDLLGARERLRLPPAARALASGASLAEVETLTVAALRVEFVREDPDDEVTSGNGTFDLSTGNPGDLDPPPHDAAYFRRQLSALSNYFTAVSSGHLVIDAALYPAGDTDAFTLPRVMRYYNPDTTQAALDIRLAEFFRDAVEAADAGGVDFAGIDAVMIFHAGIGQDLLATDVPPSDLPSAFISLGELQAALAPEDPDYAGIAVDDGARFVPDGLWVGETNVLPATARRPRIEFSLLGVMVNLMGSQLGLPSLFNTDSGAPGIGRFGLMDQGAGNEAGRLPAAPCAWSRFFLGWEDPVVVQNADDVILAPPLSTAEQPGLVLIPIDSREYFLLENRQQDLDGDGTFNLIDSLGTIVGVTANEYDAAIPGSGLLIWHIDEAVVQAGLDDNTVNADYTHRGVDLEEADGIDDIGLRPDGGYGLAEDLFFDPNATRFGPSTLPPSTSNRGHQTHILVDEISTSRIGMTFSVSIDIAQPGWPDSTQLALAGSSLVAGDIDGEPGAEVVAVTADGTLLGQRADGSDLFAPVDLGGAARGMPLLIDLDPARDGLEIVAPSAAGVRAFAVTAGQAVELGDWSQAVAPAAGTELLAVTLPLAEPPFIGDIPVMIGADGLVHAWSDSETRGFSVDPGGTPRSNLARFTGFERNALILATATELVTLTIDHIDLTVTVTTQPLPATVGNGALWVLAESVGGTESTWVVEHAGRVHLFDGAGRLLPGWPRRTGDTHAGPPALADLRGDGFLDLLLPGTGKLWALARTGALLEGWPAMLDTAATTLPLTSGPVVTDLDNDGVIDVAIGSPAGGLAAFDRGGRPLAGWPLAAGSGNSGTPTLADLDGDDDIELVVAGDGGWLYAYDLTGPVGTVGDDELPRWPERGGHQHCFCFSGALQSPPAAAELLATDSIVIYPNPTAGSTNIRFALGGSGGSEVTVSILDATGRLVRELAQHGTSGTLNEVHWDGRDDNGDAVPSGIYVTRITVASGSQTVQQFRHIAVTR